MHSRHRLVLAVSALLAGAILGCSDSTAPTDVLRVGGGAVTGTLRSRSDTAVYHYDAVQGEGVAFLLSGEDVYLAVAGPDDVQLRIYRDSNPRVAIVVPAVTGRLTLVLRTYGPSDSTSFSISVTAVNVAPEQIPRTLTLGDTVRERIDGVTDLDEFEFDNAEERDLVITLHADAVSPVGLWLGDQITSPYLDTRFGSATAAQALDALPQFVHVHAGHRYRVRVAAPSAVGGYQLVLRPVIVSPEQPTHTIAAGDSLFGESIDYKGDVDLFTLTGAPASLVNVFAQATGGTGNTVTMSVLNQSAGIVAHDGEGPLETPSGIVTFPASGQLTVKVTGATETATLTRGSYRLYTRRVDGTQEQSLMPVATGTTVLDGMIDFYGDRDEVEFDLPVSRPLALRAITPAPNGGRLAMTVDGVSYFAYTLDSTLALYGTGRLTAGHHVLRIAPTGSGTRDTYRGAYRVWLALPDEENERVPTALAVGDSTDVETLAWPYDVDHFRITAGQIDTVLFEVRRLTPSAPDFWENSLTGRAGAGGSVGVPPGTGAGGATFTNDRWLSLRTTTSAGDTVGLTIKRLTRDTVTARYRVRARRVSAAPEHYAATNIALEDVVSDSMDFAGDIDNFAVQGTAGDSVWIEGGWTPTYAPPFLLLVLEDPATGAIVTRTMGDIGSGPPAYGAYRAFAGHPALPGVIPASGTMRLRVCAVVDCAAGDHPLAPYWARVRRVNHAPEQSAASIAVGDTVRTEVLDGPYDVDEFTLTGAGGQRVQLHAQFQYGYHGSLPDAGVEFDLLDQATGAVLTGTRVTRRTSTFDEFVSPAVSLPATGTFRVRVRGYRQPNYLPDSGPFQLVVAPAP